MTTRKVTWLIVILGVIAAFFIGAYGLTTQDWRQASGIAGIVLILMTIVSCINRIRSYYSVREEVSSGLLMASAPTALLLWGFGMDYGLAILIALSFFIVGFFCALFVRMDSGAYDREWEDMQAKEQARQASPPAEEDAQKKNWPFVVPWVLLGLVIPVFLLLSKGFSGNWQLGALVGSAAALAELLLVCLYAARTGEFLPQDLVVVLLLAVPLFGGLAWGMGADVRLVVVGVVVAEGLLFRWLWLPDRLSRR